MSELKVIASELVPVYEREDSERMVNARDLHTGIQSKQQYADWIKDRVEKYGFEQGKEYFINLRKNPNGAGRPKTEYFFTVDAAKEICMLERNEQGRTVRKYFIDVEKKAREMFQVPRSLPEALRLAAELAEKIEADKPKVLFAETCQSSSESILIRELAKVCSKNKKIGQNNLFRELRKWGLLNSHNEPYQAYIERGYFEVIQRPIVTSEGTLLKFTTKVLPKGQAYIMSRLAQ